MEKRKYEKPMLVSEAFIPNEYVAVCPDTGRYEPLPDKAPLDPNTKFYLDYNRTGYPNDGDDNLGKNPVNTDGSDVIGAGSGSNNYWGWECDEKGNINMNIRYRLFDKGNGTIYYAYKEEWVSNKSIS